MLLQGLVGGVVIQVVTCFLAHEFAIKIPSNYLF